MKPKSNSQHIWQFSRVGGVNRVNLERGVDLQHLGELDQKLWTALSCPVDGLEIDSNTLKLFDSDNDGKIRVPEVIKGVNWILSLIKNPDDLLKRPKSMPLSAINTDNPDGEILLASAEHILKNLGKHEISELTITETSDTHAIFADTAFNGDGVITELSADDDETKEWIGKIIECAGSVTDYSGNEGINSEIIETFSTACENYMEWQKKKITDPSSILPFGHDTDEAYELFKTLQPKIDDYFLRCRLAEFDPLSRELLNNVVDRIEEVNKTNLTDHITEIETLPIARIAPDKAISFTEPLNPAWSTRAIKFLGIIENSDFVEDNSLTESKWLEIKESFSVYTQWLEEKEGDIVENLGFDAVELYLNNEIKTKLELLVDRDLKLETESNNILQVDKLVRFYCHIFTLLNNFVSFSDFYSPDYRAIFQAGTMYFDQRSCDLCIKVSDLGKHNLMAGNSGICLVYFKCVSKVVEKEMTIVAAFTDGDIDNLEEGRNAVFYDNQGLDWDATIIKIVENPISIRQAFWAPYRKISKMISNQVKKIAESQDDKITSAASSSVEKAGTSVESGIDTVAQQQAEMLQKQSESTKPAPFDIGKFAGIFAAIGLAFAAIGAVLSSIIGGFLKLAWWKMPLVILGVLLIISGPSMFLAWLKLRKRNLAPVLDANGWAVNARAIINISFGRSLTHLAKLPKNSHLNLKDPFKKKRNPWITAIIFLAIAIAAIGALWYFKLITFPF